MWVSGGVSGQVRWGILRNTRARVWGILLYNKSPCGRSEEKEKDEGIFEERAQVVWIKQNDS